jgi:putative membrane protein
MLRCTIAALQHILFGRLKSIAPFLLLTYSMGWRLQRNRPDNRRLTERQAFQAINLLKEYPMQIKYRLFALALMAAVTAPIPALAMSTADFVKTVAVANKFEIDSSKLALRQSHSRGVRDFAQHMVSDHSKAGDDMQDALSQARTRVTPPHNLDMKHRAMMNKLRNLSGRSFDREYIKMQVDAHHEAVKLFSDYSRTGGDRSIRSFALHTLPTLKEHKYHINRLQQVHSRRDQASRY